MLDFLAYLELERGLSRNTLEAYRSDLLQFGRFLERRGVGVLEARHADLALRDRAVLEMMYACGLRVSELTGLALSDIDSEEAMLRARGKGSKERLVPVGRRAMDALNTYLARGRPALVGARVEAKLFLNN